MLDTATFTLALGKRSGRIFPLLFGHNLEHTRSQIWHGISAELLRGRKIFGTPQRNGVGRHWHPIGPPQTHFALEPDNTYTRRHDPAAWGRRREMSSQRICNVAEGTTRGIGQRGIPLRGGQTYETRIALRSDSDLPATVRIVEPVCLDAMCLVQWRVTYVNTKFVSIHSSPNLPAPVFRDLSYLLFNNLDRLT